MYFFLSMFYLIISHFEEEMGNDQDQIHYIVLNNCKIKYESIREVLPSNRNRFPSNRLVIEIKK